MVAHRLRRLGLACRRVTVTDTVPAGLTVTVTAVAGAGWVCTAGTTTTTCTRPDGLRRHDAHPQIRISVNVAADVPERVVNTATVRTARASDSIPLRDDCPYGWSTERTVAFAPPASGIDSGVANPERADGCTLLDAIWSPEPFANHAAFVAHVRQVTGDVVRQRQLVDRSGHVVADRYVSSGRPIPQATNPVPYHLPLAFGTVDRMPEPWVRIPSPIGISSAHRPATFVRGQAGATLTLTVTNRSNRPTDGSPVLVTDEIPAGLTVTSATGTGWTCAVEGPLTCTRTEVLAPHRSYPPIVVRAGVADAPATLVHQPALLGHGEAWSAETTETITVRTP